MKSFSIQFHSTPDEIWTFIRRWTTAEHLHAIAVSFPPYSARHVSLAELASDSMPEGVSQLFLTREPPLLPVAGNMELLDRNPEALDIQIGRLRPESLQESAISAACATDTWKRITRDFKKHTAAGAIGTSVATGAEDVYRNHRYTPGARKLADQGMAMLSLTGAVKLRFGTGRST